MSSEQFEASIRWQNGDVPFDFDLEQGLAWFINRRDVRRFGPALPEPRPRLSPVAFSPEDWAAAPGDEFSAVTEGFGRNYGQEFVFDEPGHLHVAGLDLVRESGRP